MLSRSVLPAVVLALVLALPSVTSAQTRTGALTGVVVTTGGGPVADASVVLTAAGRQDVRHLLARSTWDVTTVAYRNNFSCAWYKLENVMGTSLSNVLSAPANFPQQFNVLRGGDSAANALLVRNNSRTYFGTGVTTVSRMRTRAGTGALVEARATDATFALGASAEYTLTSTARLFASVQNLTNNVYVVSRDPAGVRPGLPRLVMIGLNLELGR